MSSGRVRVGLGSYNVDYSPVDDHVYNTRKILFWSLPKSWPQNKCAEHFFSLVFFLLVRNDSFFWWVMKLVSPLLHSVLQMGKYLAQNFVGKIIWLGSQGVKEFYSLNKFVPIWTSLNEFGPRFTWLVYCDTTASSQ